MPQKAYKSACNWHGLFTISCQGINTQYLVRVISCQGINTQYLVRVISCQGINTQYLVRVSTLNRGGKGRRCCAPGNAKSKLMPTSTINIIMDCSYIQTEQSLNSTLASFFTKNLGGACGLETVGGWRSQGHSGSGPLSISMEHSCLLLDASGDRYHLNHCTTDEGQCLVLSNDHFVGD